MANGTISRWKGGSWPDVFGGHVCGAADYKGPSTYTNPGGDPIPFNSVIGAGTRAHQIIPALTTDGLYWVLFTPNSAAGVPDTWVAHWYTVSGTATTTKVVGNAFIATQGSGQTPGIYNINGSGGGGTGAVLQVIVDSTGAIGSVSVKAPGTGYSTAPTFTVAAGGTPGTVTATLSTIVTSGGLVEVSNGTDLSGSSAVILAIGK